MVKALERISFRNRINLMPESNVRLIQFHIQIEFVEFLESFIIVEETVELSRYLPTC